MKSRRVLVVGLGSFGASLVRTLWENNAEIIALDTDNDAVDAVKRNTAAAFVGDGTDPAVLEGVGAPEVDTAVVTFGEHFEASVLSVASLHRMGIPSVVARAVSFRQAEILRAVGATRVIRLEDEMGHRVGLDITAPIAADMLDFAGQYRVVPWDAHGPLVGKSLAEAEVRKRYGINVLGIRRYGAAPGRGEKPRLEPPRPEYIIGDGDTLLIVGEEDQLSRFVDEVGE